MDTISFNNLPEAVAELTRKVDELYKFITDVLTQEPASKLKMDIDEALIYLNEQGYPISKSTMYKHTMAGTIPFSRFGERKIIFDLNELDQWISEHLTGKSSNEVVRNVASSARRKIGRGTKL